MYYNTIGSQSELFLCDKGGDFTQNKGELENDLILSWVKLSGIVKNSRITSGLKYNEAIVMLSIYSRYLLDGEGLTSVQDIIKETGMLKSLTNRTLGELEKQGLIVYTKGTHDRRTKYVKCVEEKLPVFLEVHNSSVKVAEKIIDIIGEDDTETFINIVNKLNEAGYKAYPQN